jgi:hypothetical protein
MVQLQVNDTAAVESLCCQEVLVKQLVQLKNIQLIMFDMNDTRIALHEHSLVAQNEKLVSSSKVDSASQIVALVTLDTIRNATHVQTIEIYVPEKIKQNVLNAQKDMSLSTMCKLSMTQSV